MYCQKLKEVLNHYESINHCIDISIIEKLDYFLKHKVTIRELEAINPARFASEMSVDYKITLRLFTICKKVGLFNVVAYYHCTCGESFRIYSKNEMVDCPNECIDIPNNERDRIYIYFELLCNLDDCDFIDHNKYIADFIEDKDLGKTFASYPDFENVVGNQEAELIMPNFLDTKVKKYLGEKNGNR